MTYNSFDLVVLKHAYLPQKYINKKSKIDK